MNEDTKPCPFCTEQIHVDAVKCRHCGEFLADGSDTVEEPEKKKKAASACLIAVLVLAAVLFVGVAVLGIVAAIALPQLMEAIDRGRQRRSMAQMRNIATANARMLEDAGQYAWALADLQAGGYMSIAAFDDGWDNAMVYTVSEDQSTYTITSLGSDGAAGPPPPEPWINSPYDSDLVLTDGQFTQAPAGR